MAETTATTTTTPETATTITAPVTATTTTATETATTTTAPETAETLPRVTLHWLNGSRAQRMIWLLEECKGCTYDIKTYKRGEDKLAPPALKKVHPLGKSPTIVITSAERPEGFVIAESGFEVEYLCEYFAQHLIPSKWQAGKENKVGGETEQWLRYRYFMHYAEGSLMSLLLLSYIADNMKTAPAPFFIKPITRIIAGKLETGYVLPNMKTHFNFLEEQLKTSPDGGEYLCGRDLTAADILMSFPLIAASPRIDKAAYPKLTAYTAKLEAHDGHERGVKKIEEVTGEKYKTY